MVTFKSLAQSVLVSDLPRSFLLCGRREYKALPANRSSGFSILPYHSPGGELWGDWSWKPLPAVQAAINRGNYRFAFRSFDDYLRDLSPRERERILAEKRRFEANWVLKLKALESTIRDQMEGYADDNEGTANPGPHVSGRT